MNVIPADFFSKFLTCQIVRCQDDYLFCFSYFLIPALLGDIAFSAIFLQNSQHHFLSIPAACWNPS